MACCGGGDYIGDVPIADITPYEPSPDIETNHVVLMINGSSGGNRAKALLNLELKHFRMEDEVSWVWFCNLKDSDSRTETLANIKGLHDDPTASVRIVACGGDGTVKWVIELLATIDCAGLPIGVIPFGTGNDMSRISGWGGSAPNPLIGKRMKSLKKRIRRFLQAKVETLDVWSVEIKTDKEQGKILKVDGVDEVPFMEADGETPVKTFTEDMINYFSIGADAKIVVEFEKNRKKTQFRNKVEYARQITKQVVKTEPKMRSLFSYVHGGSGDNEMPLTQRFMPNRVCVFQNIPSYAAGQTIWGLKKQRKSGLGPQKIGDGLLEAIGLRSVFHVPFHTNKVAQQDSYEIGFQPNLKRVYMQVDGEGRVVVCPTSAIVKKSATVQLLIAR